MSSRRLQSVFAFLLVLFVSTFVYSLVPPTPPPGVTRENIERLWEGMLLVEVEAMLGTEWKRYEPYLRSGVFVFDVSWKGEGFCLALTVDETTGRVIAGDVEHEKSKIVRPLFVKEGVLERLGRWFRKWTG